MDEAFDGLKKPASPMRDFSITSNPALSLLAQEIELRNEMLHALVKDKNNTPVWSRTATAIYLAASVLWRLLVKKRKFAFCYLPEASCARKRGVLWRTG